MAATLADPVKMIAKGAPRLIHNDEELERYTSALFRLSEIEHPSGHEVEAMELLGTLIEKYESERFPMEAAPPRELLRFLMEQHGLRQRDLVPEFGSESQVSMFLSGRRHLTVEQIRRLSARFHVEPGIFLLMPE